MGTVVEKERSAELLAAQQLEEAAKFLDLEPWIVRRLRQCEREIAVNLEVIRDDGDAMMFRGLRVQHSAARGPCMGPLMFARDFAGGSGHALAMWLTWQSALWDLPFGGSAGSISASLEELSEREARLLTRGYAESLAGVIGGERDIITPEKDAHPEVSAWLLHALGKMDRKSAASVMGKPLALGGVPREKIAALALRTVIESALRSQGTKLVGAQIAMAGFGREIRWVASALDAAGGRLVAVCDRSGALFHRSRLDLRPLMEYVEKEDVVYGYPDAQAMSAEEMMQLPCEVLILGPGYDLVTSTKARMVVENGGAVNCSWSSKVVVVPALLGDAGLRIADFLEWRKSTCGIVSDREMLRGMQALVRKTWNEVWEHAQKYEIRLDQSAMAIAVGRVAQAMRMG
jgi:glutamate dehydrogenase (NAD(P)+)